MPYNRFTIYLIIRILLILINLIGISYFYDRADLLYSLVFIVLILVVQIVSLIQFVNKTNSELSKFILALRDADYTAKFPEAENESFHVLYQRFQNTLELYKKKEVKYEAQYLFIQELIDNIETGLIAFDKNNKTVLINRIARQFRADYRFGEDRPLSAALDHHNDTQVLTGKRPDGKKIELLVNRSSFKLLNETQTIYTFKDISTPLETKEIESWQKLIRILAHEIINSLTPITSLSETTLLILKNSKYKEELSDIELSLDTIKERSLGLLNFMEDYRKLVKVPVPKPEVFNISERIQGLLHLFQTQLQNIQVSEDYPHNSLCADPILFDQVIVNLLTNSIQALEGREQQQIQIEVSLQNEIIQVRIKDNGCGMDADTQAKAMIPFFTTKDEGSGIGLSLVQQIMNLHGGKLEIETEAHIFTAIKLRFLRQNQ